MVGSYLVERLLADGWRVRGLARTAAGVAALAAAGAEAAVGDVLDFAAFERAAKGREVVFHTAAAITPRGGWDAFRLNIDGTTNAIRAAERAGARLLHLSSVAVYGPGGRYRSSSEKTDEDTPLEPLPERAYYARSKRESEQLVLDAHAESRVWATAVRPDVIYGKRDRQFVPRIARVLRHGLAPLIDGGRATLAVVHAANVADGAVRAVTTDAAGGRAYNLANDYDVTLREFLTLAGEGLGHRVRFVPVPLAIANGAFRAAKAVLRVLSGGRMSVLSTASLDMLTRDNPFSSERARTELGWAPAVTPQAGIPEAFTWWLTHH